VTQVLELPTAATTYPASRPRLPATQAAEEFYRRGSTATQTREVEINTSDGWGRTREWLVPYVEERLNELLRLPGGWDGFRARPLTDAAVRSAVLLLFAIANDETLPPQFFPLPDGGVQMEWHVAGESVEIEIDGLGDGHVSAIDRAGQVTFESDLTPDSPSALRTSRETVARLSAVAAGASRQ
jgi:hypothetical protein